MGCDPEIGLAEDSCVNDLKMVTFFMSHKKLMSSPCFLFQCFVLFSHIFTIQVKFDVGCCITGKTVLSEPILFRAEDILVLSEDILDQLDNISYQYTQAMQPCFRDATARDCVSNLYIGFSIVFAFIHGFWKGKVQRHY